MISLNKIYITGTFLKRKARFPLYDFSSRSRNFVDYDVRCTSFARRRYLARDTFLSLWKFNHFNFPRKVCERKKPQTGEKNHAHGLINMAAISIADFEYMTQIVKGIDADDQ